MNSPCTTKDCNTPYTVCSHLNDRLCINCAVKANKAPHNFCVTYSNCCMYCFLEGTLEFLADDFIDTSDCSITFNYIYSVYEIGYADGQNHRIITINKDKIDGNFIRLLHFYEAGHKAGHKAAILKNIVDKISPQIEAMKKYM